MSRDGMRKDQCRRGAEGGLKATSWRIQKINKDKTHKKTRWNQRLNARFSKPEMQINHSQLKTHIYLGPNMYLSDKYMNEKYVIYLCICLTSYVFN